MALFFSTPIPAVQWQHTPPLKFGVTFLANTSVGMCCNEIPLLYSGVRIQNNPNFCPCSGCVMVTSHLTSSSWESQLCFVHSKPSITKISYIQSKPSRTIICFVQSKPSRMKIGFVQSKFLEQKLVLSKQNCYKLCHMCSKGVFNPIHAFNTIGFALSFAVVIARQKRQDCI
jgi:hypothetical protein